MNQRWCRECNRPAGFFVGDPQLPELGNAFCADHVYLAPQRRIYISGPITGYDNRNIEAFREAEDRLLATAQWDIVVNPLKTMPDVPYPGYEDYMRKDLRTVTDCDAICLLAGHESSNGSRMELAVAEMIGLEVRLLDDWAPPIRIPYLASHAK